MAISLLRVIETAILTLVWTLTGHALLPGKVRSASNRLLVWSSALALGAGVTSLALTGLAILHAFRRRWVVGVAIVTGLMATAELLRMRRARGRQRYDRRGVDGLEMVGLALLATVLLLTLAATLAPPSSMDSTVYHLRAPLEFLRTGTWSRMEESQTFQPLYVETLFAEGIALDGGVLAALAHWILGLGAVAAAGAWAKRLGGSAVWGAVVFGATGLYVWESTSAFIDLGLALFSSLALFWATSAEEGWQPTILSGVLAGLACGSKFTGIIAAALAGFGAFATHWPRWRMGARRMLAIAGLAVLVGLPWYLRDLSLTGNPIYPLANPLFGLPPMVFSTVTYGIGRDPFHLLTSPIDLIARGDAFDQGWSVGPAYLAFIPLALATGRSRLTFAVAGTLAVWWVIWFYASPQTRLLLPFMPVAAGLASVGIGACMTSPSKALRLAGCAVLALSACGALGTAALAVKNTGKVVAGLESEATFLERNSWNFIAYQEINRTLPSDAKVAVSGAANNLYYLDREASFLGHEPLSEADLRRSGFTHELWVFSCPLPSLRARSRLLMEGTYPLRASRLGGGVYMQACYRLSQLPPSR